MFCYWFSRATLRDGRPIPPIGEWLEHVGPVVPCKSGYHGSEDPFDALQYARGPLLHRVELEGDLTSHGNPPDKWAGRRRRIIASIDAMELLRTFARKRAAAVVYLWGATEVVRNYLETGNECLREAARAVAKIAVAEADYATDNATACAALATCAASWPADEAVDSAVCACRSARAAIRAAVAGTANIKAIIVWRPEFADMVDAAFAAAGARASGR
jgi:hypothetical protein